MTQRCRHFYEDPHMIPAFFLIAGIATLVAIIMMVIRDQNVCAIISLLSLSISGITLLYNRKLTNNVLTITMLTTFITGIVMAFIALWQMPSNPTYTSHKDFLESVGIRHKAQ